MKETIRTASVLEIYNQAIVEFSKEKTKLELRLSGLIVMNKSKNVVRGIVFIICALLTVFFFISGIAILANSHDTGVSVGGVYFIVSVFFLGIAYVQAIDMRGKNKNEDEINRLTSRIQELDREISDRKMKIKSLLQAEEVIVAKDLKTTSGKVTTQPFSDYVNQTNEEKVCPMCAETIKTAAKICRYCGHKFDQ
jgi:hypothetical protein